MYFTHVIPIRSCMLPFRHSYSIPCLLIACILCSTLYAQDTLPSTSETGTHTHKEPPTTSFSLSLMQGTVFAHSEDVENTRGAMPFGIDLSYRLQDNSRKTWNLCKCIPLHWFSLGYTDFDTQLLGKNLTASYSLEPWYWLGERLFFAYRARIGLSYLTSPYDRIDNPGNQSYSGKIGGYLALGAGLTYFMSETITITPELLYQHISNGAIKLPNKGINWPTASIHLAYRQGKTYPRRYHREPAPWNFGTLRFDAGVFTASKGVILHDSTRNNYSIAGALVQSTVQVGRINNVFLRLEAYKDFAAKKLIDDYGYITTMS